MVTEVFQTARAALKAAAAAIGTAEAVVVPGDGWEILPAGPVRVVGVRRAFRTDPKPDTLPWFVSDENDGYEKYREVVFLDPVVTIAGEFYDSILCETSHTARLATAGRLLVRR